jgi:hypothetical protein
MIEQYLGVFLCALVIKYRIECATLLRNVVNTYDHI